MFVGEFVALAFVSDMRVTEWEGSARSSGEARGGDVSWLQGGLVYLVLAHELAGLVPGFSITKGEYLVDLCGHWQSDTVCKRNRKVSEN